MATGETPRQRAARLHRERLDPERPLAALREEVAANEASYNGKGEAEVVSGVTLAIHLQRWREDFELRNERFDQSSIVMGPVDWLKEMTGLHARRVYGLVNAEYPVVSLTQAELVLMVIGQEHLLGGEIPIVPNPNWSMEKWTTYMEDKGCI